MSVPLARTWFGPDAVRDPWLAEGLAMWTGHAAIGSSCPEPVAPQIDVPETGTPETDAPETDAPETDSPQADTPEADPLDLGDWIVAGPVDEKATWNRSRYQSAVTCGIVETAAESIGPEAMTAIVADLLASPAPVSATDWLVEVAVASDADTVSALRSRIAEVGLAL